MKHGSHLILFTALMLTAASVACAGGRRSGGAVETPTIAPEVEEDTTAPATATPAPGVQAPLDSTEAATQPSAPVAPSVTAAPTEQADDEAREEAERALEELEQLLGNLGTLESQGDNLDDTP